MSNDFLNEYFENAIREWAVQHFNAQMELAGERADSESQELIDREIRWHEKQNDIIRQGDTLLIKVAHPDGAVIWKIPAKDAEFVKNALPVFAKALPPLEPFEAAELRSLQNKRRRDRWRLKPAERETLEREIENAKAVLERAKSREPIPRYGIYKTIEGRDVGVHRLYLNAREDEQASAFDGDMTNFCAVPLRYKVQRNFGLTEHQQKKLAPVYRETRVPNLFILSSESNPSHARMQSDFERNVILADDPEQAANVRPNDIPTPISPRLRRAGEALDALFEK
jgi:hypothetical protein